MRLPVVVANHSSKLYCHKCIRQTRLQRDASKLGGEMKTPEENRA